MNLTELSKPYSPNETNVIRMLLMGVGGSGKTTAACTFPNPIIVDFDNNTPPELKVQGVQHLPIYDPAWLEDTLSRDPSVPTAGKRAWILYPLNYVNHFLLKHTKDLTTNDTIIFDSLSMHNDMMLKMIKECEAKEIKNNSYHLWAVYAEWLTLLHTIIKGLPCNFVMICHEDEVRDNETNRLLSLRWLMDGKKFAPRITSFYNNVFRQVRMTDAPTVGAVKPDETAKVEYYWQIQPDPKFQARTTIKTKKRYVKPDYKSFGITG